METHRRLIFTFDEDSEAALETLRQGLGVDTYGEALREAIILARVFQELACGGFTDAELINPKTKEVMHLTLRYPKHRRKTWKTKSIMTWLKSWTQWIVLFPIGKQTS